MMPWPVNFIGDPAMLKNLVRLAAFVTLASTSLIETSARAQAQAYPIDCAILLCLSGGWPASAPCAQARAEFIRRVTPWPVEPPLQIWRCPMSVSYQGHDSEGTGGDVYDILFKDARPALWSRSGLVPRLQEAEIPSPAVLGTHGTGIEQGPRGLALHLVQHRADIDISGPEFDFVRSIRVYDVRHAHQQEAVRDRECIRSALVFIGTYGTQGDFSWRRSTPGALPVAHVGLESWGAHCPGINHRSVFVDWRDYDGNYGFEQVNY
jgi:hypothetical protein